MAILTVYHAILTFNDPYKEGFGKQVVEKGEKTGYQHFLLFPQCFLLYQRDKMLNLLFAHAFGRVQNFGLW